VAVGPGRWARVLVRPAIAGRPERQAADAVRRGMEGNEARSLDLHDSGVDVTLGHDGRHRWRAHAAAPRLLETFLTTGTARGWRPARSTQRTDSTPVVAAMRTRPRVACVLEARPAARHPLRAAAPGGGSRGWRGRGTTATVSVLTRDVCPKRRARAKRAPTRAAETALSSGIVCGPPSARHAAVTSPLERRSGRAGGNTMTVGPSPGSQRSGGARRPSHRRQPCV
jgi:hypothetical protein